MSLPPPNALGAPFHFSKWRAGQDDVLVRAWGSEKRFIVLDLPTGVGKSLINIVFNTAQDWSFQYDTSSRGLQDQVLKEMRSTGLIDVRGMQNYECLELAGKKWNTCDRGPCLDGGDCQYRFKGCLYYDQVKLAKSQKRILTNYAMDLAFAKKKDSLGPRDCKIFDEAHDAADHVAAAMRISFSRDEVMLPAEVPSMLAHWQDWAEKQLPSAKRELSGAVTGTQEHRELKSLVERLETLIEIPGDAWVWEVTPEGRAILEPVWPDIYCEKMLYRGVGKLVFSSATMTRSDLKYLGLQENQVEWISALCPFPAVNRPLVYIPTCAMSQNMSDEDVQKMVDRGDEIMEREAGHKGIIHSVSYKLAKLIYHASKYTKRMILPTPRTTREAVARFKASKEPLVLISPAVDTGYDFPYDAARWQWIPKLPFPPVKGSLILGRRALEDPKYANHITMKRIVQMYGRVNRAEDDEGRTYITDDQWGIWFWPKMHKSFPGWLREAYHRESTVPAAPAARAA